MKLVPFDYECVYYENPKNNLDKEISEIYKTSHSEDIKARLYTTALKKYLFKTFKNKNAFKNIKKQIKFDEIKDLSFQLPNTENFEPETDLMDKSNMTEFKPTLASTPTKEHSVPFEKEETTIKKKSANLSPRKTKIKANKNLKTYFENFSDSDKTNIQDKTWVNY